MGLCVRPYQQKSALTFEREGGLAQNFQSDPEAPEIGSFCQIEFLPVFCSEGVVTYLFGIEAIRQNKMFGSEF